MNKRLISVFVFALTVSAGAAFVLYQLISSKVTAGAASHPTTKPVFVASRDLQPGALITERDISKQEYVTVPNGAITKKEDILNRGVISAIHRDTPFFDGTLTKQGEGAGFATIIPPGMRAFTVRVNEVVGVAGFAVAGMHVDVLVAGTPPGGSQGAGSISRTLLQDISVLSAGQNYQKDAEGKPVMVQVVNLLVTPAQAEMLNLATDQRIQLVLRNPTDNVITQTSGAATANLFEGSAIHSSRVNFSSSDSAAAPAPNGAFAPRPRRKPEPQVAAVAAPAPPVAPTAPPAAKTAVVEVLSGGSRSQIIINRNANGTTETAQ
jgi:pilus assembly protein CpaB